MPRKLTGDARYTTYGNLDLKIMKDSAPWAPEMNGKTREFISVLMGGLRVQGPRTKMHRLNALEISNKRGSTGTSPPPGVGYSPRPASGDFHLSGIEPRQTSDTALTLVSDDT